MRRLLYVTLALSIAALTGCLCAALLTLQSTLAYLPRYAVETRGVLVAEIRTARAKSLAQISRVVDGDPKSKSAAGRLPLRELLVREIDSQAGATRAAATSQLDELRTDLFEGDASVVARLDSKTDQALQVVTDLKAQLKPSIDNVITITKHAADVTAHASAIAAHVEETLPQFTDCVYYDENGEPVAANEDCVFNRYQGISKAAEQMLRAAADAAPKIAKSAEGVAADVKKEADIITAPRTPIQKAGDWVKLILHAASALL
jgi:hypothetical protein